MSSPALTRKQQTIGSSSTSDPSHVKKMAVVSTPTPDIPVEKAESSPTSDTPVKIPEPDPNLALFREDIWLPILLLVDPDVVLRISSTCHLAQKFCAQVCSEVLCLCFKKPTRKLLDLIRRQGHLKLKPYIPRYIGYSDSQSSNFMIVDSWQIDHWSYSLLNHPSSSVIHSLAIHFPDTSSNVSDTAWSSQESVRLIFGHHFTNSLKSLFLYDITLNRCDWNMMKSFSKLDLLHLEDCGIGLHSGTSSEYLSSFDETPLHPDLPEKLKELHIVLKKDGPNRLRLPDRLNRLIVDVFEGFTSDLVISALDCESLVYM